MEDEHYLKEFWNKKLNPVTGWEYKRGFDVSIRSGGELAPQREGINQHFYAHDRMRFNPMIYDFHKNGLRQKHCGSGEVRELFSVKVKIKAPFQMTRVETWLVTVEEMRELSKENKLI